MKKSIVLGLFVCACTSWAQLATDQKVQDFQNLASLYAKQYAPYEWKKQLLGFDLFNISPWLDRVKKSKDDLEFYEIMAQYVTSLNDIHSAYFNPSDFEAYLGFRVDIYDGKFVIDFVNRSFLPSRNFPFQAGDELVMVDGKAPEDYIKDFSALVAFANPGSTRRFVTDLITDRLQFYIPRAEEVGKTATVVIRRQSGNLETYTVPWAKFGTPLTQNGPVPTPRSAPRNSTAALPGEGGSGRTDPYAYRHPVSYLASMVLPNRKLVRNIDSTAPIFAPPTGFVQRLGRGPNDFFYSGTYKSNGKTIGLIRIADFEPTTFDLLDIPEAQFDREIAFMEKNTDGLVVDVMHNPGGFGCYAEDLMSRLATKPFYGLNLELRPTIVDVQSIAQGVQDAIDFGAEQWEIDTLKAYQAEVLSAYKENRGMTGPLPVCGLTDKRDPNTDINGNLAIYDKPVLLLTDEFTISAGDFFSAMFQDAQRGKNFGMRTSGAGGSIAAFPSGFYSEGTAFVTQTLGIRQHPVVTPDYPTAPLIENIGVRPEIQYDYQTVDNLLKNGRPFVDAFTAAILGMLP